MKILFLIHSFLSPNNTHGVGVVAYEIAKQLKNKHEVVVIDRSFDSEYKIDIKSYDGIKNYTISSPRPDHNILRDHGYHDKRIIDLLESIIKQEPGFEVVNVHHLSSWTIDTIDLLKRFNFKIVLTIHDTWYLCPSINYFNRYHHQTCSKDLRESTDQNCAICIKSLGSYRFKDDLSLSWITKNILGPRGDYLQLFNKMDAIIYPTTKCKQYYLHEGAHHPVTKIIPPFIEISKTNKKLREEFVFGFIGNIGFGKGLEFLIQAFKSIKNPKIKLHIYGSLFDDNIKLDTSNGIEYKGPYNLNSLGEILSEIDTVVVPSYFPESFNLCSYASIMSETPLVVSRIAYHEEFLKENLNCLVFETNNVLSLYEKMIQSYTQKITPTRLNINSNFLSEHYLRCYTDLVKHQNVSLDCSLVYILKDESDIEYLKTFHCSFKEIIIVTNQNAHALHSSISAFASERFHIVEPDLLNDVLGSLSYNAIIIYQKTNIDPILLRTIYKSEFANSKISYAYVSKNGHIQNASSGILFVKKDSLKSEKVLKLIEQY